MMKIPYLKIIEIRSLKTDLDNSDASKLSRWLYNKGYYLQCKPIIKLLKQSKDQTNHIYNTDLIEFAKFVGQTNNAHGSIRVQVSNFYGFTYCSVDFVNFNCSLRADDSNHTIWHTQHTVSKDIRKELISLNTRVSPYKEIYNEMIDFIIKYMTEG